MGDGRPDKLGIPLGCTPLGIPGIPGIEGFKYSCVVSESEADVFTEGSLLVVPVLMDGDSEGIDVTKFITDGAPLLAFSRDAIANLTMAGICHFEYGEGRPKDQLRFPMGQSYIDGGLPSISYTFGCILPQLFKI